MASFSQVVKFGGVGMLVLTGLLVREWMLMPDGKLHVHFLDVGQGDSALIVTPSGKQILIDGGPNLSDLEHLGTFMPFFDRSLDLVIPTHADADHITALPEVLRRYDVQAVMFTAARKESSLYESMLDAITAQDIDVLLPNPEEDLDFGDGLIFDIIAPTEDLFGKEIKKHNNYSIVLRAVFGSESILFTGDIEEEGERAILASGADIRSTILKVPHHGSRTSSSTGFLLAVNPELAIISAGRDNQFGHPHQDVVERYRSLGISIRSTQEEGTISLSFP